MTRPQLLLATRDGVTLPTLHRAPLVIEDDDNPARGFVVGVLLSVLVWGLIGVVLWGVLV